MTGSREFMLDRIRAAITDVPPSERPEDVAIDRSYRILILAHERNWSINSSSEFVSTRPQ